MRTLHGISLYDGDVEAADGIPPSVAKLKEAIVAADGVVLATSEYDNGIPGVFKKFHRLELLVSRGAMLSLNAKAGLGNGILALAMGLLLFIPAGTPRYWQAWGYLAVFFGAALTITIYLMKKDPALLRRRLSGGPTAEKQQSQKIIMCFASLGFVALLVVPALDFRFKWSSVPIHAVVFGDILTALGFYIVFLVYKENSFTSATIEVASDQKVISTGPYALVRHPMYAGSFLYLLGMPLALGSYWGLLPLAVMLPSIIWRLFDEERFLSNNLPGYVAYCAKVRWRLVPGVF